MLQEQKKSLIDTERLLAYTAIVYGLTLLNPWTEVFLSFPSVYNAMARQGSELLWGSVLLAAGTGQVLAHHSRNKAACKIATLFAAVMWGFLAWVFFLARLDVGLLTALTSPGVTLSMLWGWALAYKGFKNW